MSLQLPYLYPAFFYALNQITPQMQCGIMIIKNDALQSGILGELICRAEKRGLSICQMKLCIPTKEQVKELLSRYSGRPFYQRLFEGYVGKATCVVAFVGYNAVEALKHAAGSPNPVNAQGGSIRGDYAVAAMSNCVHIADTVQQAEAEIQLFFGPEAVIRLNITQTTKLCLEDVE